MLMLPEPTLTPTRRSNPASTSTTAFEVRGEAVLLCAWLARTPYRMGATHTHTHNGSGRGRVQQIEHRLTFKCRLNTWSSSSRCLLSIGSFFPSLSERLEPLPQLFDPAICHLDRALVPGHQSVRLVLLVALDVELTFGKCHRSNNVFGCGDPPRHQRMSKIR